MSAYFNLAVALTRSEAAPTLAKLATKYKAIQRIANHEETMPDIATILKNTSAATDTAPRARIRRVMNECVGSDLDSWTRFEFFPSIANRFVLTEKQEKCLAAIEARILGQTLCWRCNAAYERLSTSCPNCQAINGNVDPEGALRQVNGPQGYEA